MVVVTAPTGQIGSKLIPMLLNAEQPVRVIVRDPSRLSPEVRDRVEIVQGSHCNAAVVKEAFRDAQAVFWLVPADPKAQSIEAAYVDFSRPACEAFRSAGVRHVVGVSSYGRGTPQASQAGYITASLAMDDLIASTGVNYRALANAQFMDNLLRQVASIRSEGIIASPTPGNLKAATCATQDIASIAADLLISLHWSGQEEIPVLGPEDLSFNKMAVIMCDVLGKPIHFRELPDKVLKAGLLERGRSEAMADGMVNMMMAVRQGIYSNAARSQEYKTPTTFRLWCETVLRPAVFA